MRARAATPVRLTVIAAPRKGRPLRSKKATLRVRPARQRDLPQVERLLNDARLPLEGIPEHLDSFLVAEDGANLIAVAGLEVYGDAALLRSVAVRPAWRGKGLGQLLVDTALQSAKQKGITRVYLLSETAADYFPRFGFRRMRRQDIDERVKASVEFRSACPASAIVMGREL